MNDLGTSYGEAHLDSEAAYFGPSYMIDWLYNNYGGFKAESILINCHYPISRLLHAPVRHDRQDAQGLDEEKTEKPARWSPTASAWASCRTSRSGSTRGIDNPLLFEEDGAVYQLRRWYHQFYVDVDDVTPDMTDRFEVEVDTTAANETWHAEVEENLKTPAEGRTSKKGQSTRAHDPAQGRSRRRPASEVDAAPARRSMTTMTMPMAR